MMVPSMDIKEQSQKDAPKQRKKKAELTEQKSNERIKQNTTRAKVNETAPDINKEVAKTKTKAPSYKKLDAWG